jgi:hypothetical protein
VRRYSEDSACSIEARVMRAIGASVNSASVSEGSSSCLIADQAVPHSKAIRLSNTRKPVTCGGVMCIRSSRPNGAGATPSRK